MNPNTTATTTVRPTRATWKGHGNPRRVMYYGAGNNPVPAAKGILCMAGVEQGTTVRLTDAVTGKTVATYGTSGKFWAAPVTAKAARKPSGKVRTGNPVEDRAVRSEAAKKVAEAPAKAPRQVQQGPAPKLPAGYVVKYDNGGYKLAKPGPDAAEGGPAWLVICTAHGTTQPADKAKDGDSLGKKSGRATWCKQCQAGK